jgi:L-seryl-tRNA(Ser) seleniumtransferase
MSSYRVIPSVEQLQRQPSVAALVSMYGHDAVIDALRAETEVIRHAVRAGAPVPATTELAADVIVTRAGARLAGSMAPSLKSVLNATGVIVHTNLGRAPLPAAAIDRIQALAGGYTNLEYDTAAGARGSRDSHAEQLICRVTGAQAAVVVNNCAAATMLVLAALARGREVIVSRGELVEIGGGFRVPDVMAQSGAQLREVGTTNRTRIGDYALAISDRTGAILRVHPSNFRIEGFTERTTLADIVALAHRFDLPVIEDLGSGFVATTNRWTSRHADAGVPSVLSREPTVQASIAAGADVVCCSGDKLLGGPQAGLVLGSAAALNRIRRHPLMRALRVDKLTYAALEATLIEYLADRADETVPVLRMALASPAEIGARAERVAGRLRAAGYSADIIDGFSTIGGGSAPGSELPTRLIALGRAGLSADALEGTLRTLDPPVIARIESDRVVLDLRTVAPHDDERLIQALVQPTWTTIASP